MQVEAAAEEDNILLVKKAAAAELVGIDLVLLEKILEELHLQNHDLLQCQELLIQ